MRRTARHPTDERGTTALEFALVALLMLTIMFGIVQYGYLYWSLSTASASAREAARSLSVGTDWTCVQTRTAAAAEDPARGSATPVVTRAYHSDSGTAQTGPVAGSLVTVTVSFQSLNMGLPILPLPKAGLVEQSATARIEHIPTIALSCP